MTVAALVSSSGGHLDELVELADRLVPVDMSRVWITPRTAHAESLLRGEEVRYVSPVGARQLGRTMLAMPGAMCCLRRLAPDLLVSTGAAQAIPYLIAARLRRVETVFADSATRLQAPSMSAQMARRVGVRRLYCQAPGWDAPWQRIPSVFDGFAAGTDPAARTTRRVLVTLGTERFAMPRAVNAIADAARQLDLDVTWQLGHTPAPPGLPGRVLAWMPYSELVKAAQGTDAVVTHAGVGSILTALRAGRRPVVFARRHDLDEHVDDHQAELTVSLRETGLVLDADHGSLPALLHEAGSSSVHRVAADA